MPTITRDAADKGRTAKLLLAVLDDDAAVFNATLAEANTAPNGLHGLIATLASATLEMLTGAVGEKGARMTLSMTALDASADGYGPGDDLGSTGANL